MWSTSAVAQRTVLGSHKIRTVARFAALGNSTAQPAMIGDPVPVNAGYVRMELDADVRSTCDVTVQAPWPDSVAASIGNNNGGYTTIDWRLSPLGREIHLAQRVQLPTGVVEEIPLGYFRIDTAEEVGRGAVRVTGSDRASWILDQPRSTSITYASGQQFDTVIKGVLDSVGSVGGLDHTDIRDVVYDDAAVGTSIVGRVVPVERDRWPVVQDLCESVGRVGIVNRLGQLYVSVPAEAAVTTSTPPVWTINHTGTLSELRRRVSRLGAVNRVVVTGDVMTGAPARPVRGEATITSLASPVRVGGPFGVITRAHHSPLVTSDAAALATATSLLARWGGLPMECDAVAVPFAALDPGDPVELVTPDGAGDGLYMLTAVTHPVVAGPMQVQLRQVA